jgi:hypothetical protein
MKDKISNILYDHFGWQRKESIEKATEKIAELVRQEIIDYEVRVNTVGGKLFGSMEDIIKGVDLNLKAR